MTKKFIYMQFAIMLFASDAAYGQIGDLLQDTTANKNIKLSEVEVSRRFNPIKIVPGKLSYQVTKNSIGSSGNVLELLRKMPGVTVLPNGKISLNGQLGVQLLIDGKTNFIEGENLINFLSSMPASSLDLVELITQPDAGMDANGDARFINLKRTNHSSNGMDVFLSTNAEQGRYNRNYHTITVAANMRKLNISNTYSYAKGSDFVDVNSTRYLGNTINMANETIRLDMDAIRKKKYSNHYYNAALDYRPNDKIQMGTYVLLTDQERTKEETVGSAFYSRSRTDSTIATGNDLLHNFKNFSTGAHFTVQFAGGSKWENYLDRQHFKQAEKQEQNLDKFMGDGSPVSLQQELSGETGGRVNIMTIQSKYMLDIRPDIAASFGGKFTQVGMHTNSFYQEFNNKNWQKRPDLTNAFDHEERLKALFMQARYSASELFQIDLGLRYEDAAFNSKTANELSTDLIIARSYKNFFPNLTMTYALENKQKLSLNYHRRVNRPNFKDLSPFVEVNDPYLYERGNPTLKPEFVNNMELTWLFKNSYSLQLFYSLRQDAISKSYNLDDYKRTVVMPMNLKRASGIGLRLHATSISPLQNWNIQVNGNLIYRYFEWVTVNDFHRNRQLTPALQLQNNIKLPFKINLDVNCFWNGSTAEGQATIASLWAINSGLRKTFLQDKFTLYIYANDLLKTNRPKIIFNSDFMEGRYRESYDSRTVGINLSYRLHSGKRTNLKSDHANDRLEENSRINY